VSGRKIVPVIGLVGGVGSGKSSVAAWVASQGKVAVVSGDEAGHSVLRVRGVKEQLRQRFGSAVFDEQGEVCRRALAQLVFGTSPEQRQARTQLEKIVHPAIRELLTQQISDLRNSNAVDAILLDAAVLFEAGWNDLCDAVVFVEAPPEVRLERVAESRDWTKQTLDDREASQLPLETKRLASTETIDNQGPVSLGGARLKQILERLIIKPQ
jgi:dephospho-CoA kinase